MLYFATSSQVAYAGECVAKDRDKSGICNEMGDLVGIGVGGLGVFGHFCGREMGYFATYVYFCPCKKNLS